MPLAFELADVPGHKGFAYADWSSTPRLHVLPSMEAASNRTTLASTTPTPSGIPSHYRTGSYMRGNLRVDYEAIHGIQLGVRVRNVFDDDYQLVDGFPRRGAANSRTCALATNATSDPTVDVEAMIRDAQI